MRVLLKTSKEKLSSLVFNLHGKLDTSISLLLVVNLHGKPVLKSKDTRMFKFGYT